MKKLLKIYRNRYMLRPTVYQVVLRGLIAVVLSLLWDRFIDQGQRGVAYAFEVFGVLLWILVWFSYLKLDGVEFLERKKKAPQKRKTVFKLADIIDFTDERIDPMEGLEEDEKSACRMVSNMITGTILLLLGVILRLL